MKAAVYEDIEKISIKDIAIPKTPEGGMLVKILGCSVCGSDVRTYFFGNSMINPPWIIGHEIVGEIIENLSDNGMKKKQRITVGTAIPCGHCYHCYLGHYTMCSNMKAHGFEFPGGYAQYMAIDPYAIEREVLNIIPDNVSSDEACLTEPLACVLNAQEILNIGLGDNVVVIGTGAIGCMHIQLARVRGASKIIAFDLNKKRLEVAKKFDVDYVANPEEEDPKEIIEKIIGKEGANVIIVACGVGQAQSLALDLAAPRGRICNFGGLPKTSPMNTINANLIHYKELNVMGSFSSNPRQNFQALQLIASGKINVKPLISKVMSLDRLEEAILEMKRGESMKIIIHPNE
ncbi:zinc-binding dehydrogenase [Fusobacterium watanabei]|uniref:zinc-binding dehydrogenase n=1 Tax=Fusobacterium TaxID=848 RepID=UPI0030CE4FD2